MHNVDEITYLGDTITSNGKNTKKIQERCRKGVGLSCQILKIVNAVMLGSHTIEVALLLRNSILIGGMLTNA